MDELPKRKHPRLKNYDYSQNGYYHVTICTKDNAPLLSTVTVGRGLAPAVVELTEIGKIAEEQLVALSGKYGNIKIDKYVIMPTHIHAIIAIQDEAAGPAFPLLNSYARPTLSDIICMFKSLTTRLCNLRDRIQNRKIWQTSFFDEVIRNEAAYQEIWRYIDDNPDRWREDKYYRS